MSFSLVPDKLYRRYTDITPQMMQDWGIKLLLCDLDYTLAPRSTAVPDDALHRWLNDMNTAGITVMILSNNRSSERVNTFCKEQGENSTQKMILNFMKNLLIYALFC